MVSFQHEVQLSQRNCKKPVLSPTVSAINKLVGVYRLCSAQIWLYKREKLRGGELFLPSEGRPAIYYIDLNPGHLFLAQPPKCKGFERLI